MDGIGGCRSQQSISKDARDCEHLVLGNELGTPPRRSHPIGWMLSSFTSSTMALTFTTLPLMPLPLKQVPLVGERTTVTTPQQAVLDELLNRPGGTFGALLQTSKSAAVSWTPLLKAESVYGNELRVRCIGRASIDRVLIEPVLDTGLRMNLAIVSRYEDTPMDTEARMALEHEIFATEDLFAVFCERWRTVEDLRGQTDAHHMRALATRLPRALAARDIVEAGMMFGAEQAPNLAAAELLLTTFAALGPECATWKTRIAAMQCRDSDGRIALAQRAIRWTTRRLEAEISLRQTMDVGGVKDGY